MSGGSMNRAKRSCQFGAMKWPLLVQVWILLPALAP